MIDLFLTSDREIFSDVRAVSSVSMDADHRMVLAELGLQKKKNGTRKRVKRYRLEKLKENDTTETFKSRLSNFREVEITDPEEDWQKFRDAVKEAAEETIGMKTIYRGKKMHSLVDRKCKKCSQENENV